jgi:hypothetical protein
MEGWLKQHYPDKTINKQELIECWTSLSKIGW